MKLLQRFLAMVVLMMAIAALAGCASGKSGESDEGDVADTESDSEDAVGDVQPDSPDMETPPAPQGPTRAALSGGGGPRASQQFQLQVTVGSPVSSSRLASERYRVEVGVGPFVARPDSQ